MPDRFRLVPATISNAGSEPPSLWTVFNYPRGGDPTQRAAHYMYAVGRIKEGVAFDAAQRDMTAIGKRNEDTLPSRPTRVTSRRCSRSARRSWVQKCD